MRIIAGNYKGKKLFTPDDYAIRPTSDRAREALFSILVSMDSFSEMKVLDVFAGTGAFGLEAISRGADKVCFVDKDTTILSKNIALFEKEKNKISALKTNATNLPLAKDKYNLVFMDAPYNQGLSDKVLNQLVEKDWLDDDALVIVEVDKNEELDCPPLELIDTRTYGKSKFVFLRNTKTSHLS